MKKVAPKVKKSPAKSTAKRPVTKKPPTKKPPAKKPPAKKPVAKKSVGKVLSTAQKRAAVEKIARERTRAQAAIRAQRDRDARAKSAAAAKVTQQRAKAAANAKVQRERDLKSKALAKEKAAQLKAKTIAAARAQRERDTKAKALAKENAAKRKAREKAQAEAKRLREIENRRKTIEADKLRRQREIEHRNEEELKRQAKREGEERRRLEALDRKRHSRPYADQPELLEELRGLLLAERAVASEQIALSESSADEMLVDRERLEYDGEEGSSVGSDVARDQLKEMALRLRLKVDEIDVALTRVDDGSYGRCDECYEKIPVVRLRYQIPAFTCAACRSIV